MIFSRGKSVNIPKCNYNGLPLKVVTDYKYFGIDVNYNGKFINRKEHLFRTDAKSYVQYFKKNKSCVFL